jgi:hypothetical protein
MLVVSGRESKARQLKISAVAFGWTKYSIYTVEVFIVGFLKLLNLALIH